MALQTDELARRQLLTFVIAGGGFARVETTGAVNDFIRETAHYYPSIADGDVRFFLIHPESSYSPNWARSSASTPSASCRSGTSTSSLLVTQVIASEV